MLNLDLCRYKVCYGVSKEPGNVRASTLHSLRVPIAAGKQGFSQPSLVGGLHLIGMFPNSKRRTGAG